MKHLICANMTIWYFGVCKLVIIQEDASNNAALWQDGLPFTIASIALTPINQFYGNIKKDLLTCVFVAK